MKLASKCVGLLLGCLFAAATTPAATVDGTVKGPEGTPFRGAFVQAQNTSTHVLVSVLTDKSGHYRIENLPAGNYRLQIRAVGYRSDPRSDVNLTAEQNASYDFALQQGAVRWSDLSQYQGEVLFPEAKGKDLLVTRCFACHGFQSRMASTRRDEEGWRDRVAYMVESMHFFLGAVGGPFNEENANDVASYINSLFGEEPVLPKSPGEMPKYKELVRTFDDEAMKIVYVEYDLPGPSRMPWSAFPDKDGNYWMPYYGRANKIGRLDPKTGEVQEYPVPNQGTAAIHSAVPAADGSVWLTEQGSNKLGRWDPATRTISEFQDAYIPGKEGTVAGGSKHTLRIDSQGRVWATGGPLTVFDPKTQKFTQIKEIPSAYGLALDKDGNCWFAEYVPNGKIGKIDAKTLQVTKWQPPTPDARPRRIQVDADGTIWFAEFQAGKIGHFDPKTESFKEYALPGPEATPYALEIARNGTLWYSSEHLDVIGNLDPKTGHVTEYPFPQAENTMREFYLDVQGRMWFGTPANNKVGYFYLAGSSARAAD
ncbi:MAG TPA: carboxypeptidase regulatory-like domain-containing protein [Candidatus Acidoferrales bacterium]|nr:carboxypeptidase regulatory-like domain-containing protein [Candidatus Acidoferrales bacterium]